MCVGVGVGVWVGVCVCVCVCVCGVWCVGLGVQFSKMGGGLPKMEGLKWGGLKPSMNYSRTSLPNTVENSSI